ncbi:MAG: ATPase [Lachnospiraceae bacterium]|nr:ATPase [Lachnospiraceae bacterium]
MIAKMRFVRLTGPVSELDRAIEKYVSGHEIQLENAVAELKDITGIRSHIEYNRYIDILNKVAGYTEYVDKEFNCSAGFSDVSADDAVASLEKFAADMSSLHVERKGYLNKKEHLISLLRDIEPYSNLQFDIQKLKDFKYIKYRFGRMTKADYKKLKDYLDEDMCSIFCECDSDKDNVWGIYFVPCSEAGKVDAVYSSLHFERFVVGDEYSGSPKDAKSGIEDRINSVETKILECDKTIEEYIVRHKDEFSKAYYKVKKASGNFDVRKLAAITSDGENDSFVLCGWMEQKNADELYQELKNEEQIFFLSEEDHVGPFGGPPVKLKNPKILKPFELLIRMYGLPNYHEMDPTWFVAISYSLLFGIMFGDVGQGICLAIGGFILYKVKKMDLAYVIAVAGIFSTIFGFLFGSVFGYEELLKPLWIKPTESMASLPLVGSMNTVFAVAIVIGMALIILMMIFNIINAVRMKCMHDVLFDHNGIAGIVFYGAVCVVVLLFMTGHALPGGIVLGVMFGLPLLLILLKEPLTAIITKKTDELPKEKGVMVIQMFFEIIEVLLSYFSNTLSFVRLGGFAVSHASMMAVVTMLAGAEHGETGNILVIILGNLFVCALEGLIVGIQAMRLEYYEMFNRFYKGGGREFTPYE